MQSNICAFTIFKVQSERGDSCKSTYSLVAVENETLLASLSFADERTSRFIIARAHVETICELNFMESESKRVAEVGGYKRF